MTDPVMTAKELRPIVEAAAEYQKSDDRAEANIYRFRDALGWLMLTAPTARSVALLIARFAPLLTAYEELEAETTFWRLAHAKGWSPGQVEWAMDPKNKVADSEVADAFAAWRRATESASSPSIGGDEGRNHA